MEKMMRRIGLAIGSLMLLVCAWGSNSRADEQVVMQDENPQRMEQVTGIDEEGNIYVVEDVDGSFGDVESPIATFSISPKVVNFNTEGNVLTYYTEYLTGKSGYTNGAYGADAAYIGTFGNKVRFMLAGVVGEVYADEVEILDVRAVEVVSCYKLLNGRLYHYIAQNMKTPGYATRLDNGPAPSYIAADITYYSYDGHYFYTDYAQMLEDYAADVRTNSVNPNDPFYNYFQYLPLRSYSSYTGTELTNMVNSRVSSNSKMLNTGNLFEKHQNTYGVNALLATGLAINESAWGASEICQNKNNLFGLNAIDASPGTSASTYATVDECIRQFADGWMSRGYLYGGDGRYCGGFLGNKGSGINVFYASDPYWGEKAANYAWLLDSNAGNKDYQKYTLGIKDTLATTHNSVNVRKDANTSSAVLYNTKTYSNYAVLIMKKEAENGFYKIQSDSVLSSGRTSAIKTTGVYDATNMYGYISSDFVKVICEGENVGGSTYTNYVTKEKVNYRSGPGTSYGVLGSLAGGQRVKVEDGYSVDADGYTWYRILHNSNTYYVAASYLNQEPWYREGIDFVSSRGIMTGLRPNYFGETEKLSRAQFAVILHRTEGEPAATNANKFPDVPNGSWYTDAVVWANSKGIITGYAHNGHFGPADDITREQMAVMMYRYASCNGYPTSARVSYDSYADAYKVTDFATEAMSWAVANKIITGKSGIYLDPQGTTTRAECATIIMRFINKFE